ncbi:MAG: flagellar basal body-associated FliL family protein [Geminicoccaceae bacterium]
MSGKAADGGGGEAGKKGGKGKLLLIAGVALVLLAGGGAGAAWFLGLFGGKPADAAVAADAAAADGHGEAPADEHAAAADAHGEGAGHGSEGASKSSVAFVDLPDVVVNLQSGAGRMRFLKLRISLEVIGQSEADEIQLLTPRILDSFQLYLRALAPDDVQGAVGMQRLKEEMLARVHRAVEPRRIEDVLIREMLVQ